MATINNRFVHFKYKSDFDKRYAETTDNGQTYGDILGKSIVFIKDANKIWTHGQFYDCGSTMDASQITSGTISLDRLPAGALERCVVVANQSARFKLTTNDVQDGDTVKQSDTGVMYMVVDTTNLNNESGYITYTAVVDWESISNKPEFNIDANVQAIDTTDTVEDVPETPYVKYVAQSLSNTEKQQTRTNIGAIGQDELNTQLNSKQDTIGDIATIRSNAEKGATAVQPSSLANVATSGSYNDLSDKPTIPTGIKLNTDAVYTPDADGVFNIGYLVRQVKVNGVNKTTENGTVDIGTVITSHQDISGKADKSSLATVATSGSYNDLSDKPNIPSAVTETTVSGWGFIKSAAYSLVNHGTSDTTFTLTPNTMHVWGTVTKLTLTLGSEQSDVVNEYLFQFTSGSTATTLSLPSTVKWQSDLTIDTNKTYQVSILNGFATVLAFNN